jgi:predicted negative regulator of RcsB-dependent stress response
MIKPTAIRLGFLFGICCTSLLAQAQPITSPREPSPAASVTQTVGISTINVNYSRPSVKGREIWGKLVPYGWNIDGFGAGNSAPWRAGANENTVLTLSHAATVEGHLVPAGEYGLFFVINKDNSGEVVLSKDYRSWGSFWYDPKLDEFREKITVRDMPVSTERLIYTIEPLNKNSAELQLTWEKKQFPVKIEFAVDDIVMANAEEELKNTTGFGWQGYTSAANYALANKINNAQALKWIDQAIVFNPNFADMSVKAALLDQAGNHPESEKIMKDATAIATETDLNNYGYQLLAQKKFEKAIEILKLNAQNHPASANSWDSLGEAYALSGDKKNAITNFKKSLSMNPPANVKANSEKYLKQLGAL